MTDHPVLLASCALLMLPVLRALFRFFFEDWEGFVEATGYREQDGFWWTVLRLERQGAGALAKLLLVVVAPYALAVGLAFATAVRWMAA